MLDMLLKLVLDLWVCAVKVLLQFFKIRICDSSIECVLCRLLFVTKNASSSRTAFWYPCAYLYWCPTSGCLGRVCFLHQNRWSFA